MASQITRTWIIYSIVCSDADQRKHQLRATGLCEGNSPVTGAFPTQKASYAEIVPFGDVIMIHQGKSLAVYSSAGRRYHNNSDKPRARVVRQVQFLS